MRYRHGFCLIFVALLCLTCGNLCYASDGLYAQRIVIPEKSTPELQESARSLGHWLEQITGKPFVISEQHADQAIVLATESSANFTDLDLKVLRDTDNLEAFLITGDDTRLRIIGKTETAVDRGVHWYLDQLGCRWLLPSTRWTIIPRRTEITLRQKSFQSPAFQLRSFFGTGSFGRPAIDPDQRQAKAWSQYQRQNLLGGSIHLAGHAGEAFALRHNDDWLTHPEYLAESNGQRQVWSATANVKLCSSNPGLQKLWIDDRVQELRTQRQTGLSTRSVSVEPSDGGGHCECSACQRLGTVSDRVFFLANLTAREVQRQYPGDFVNLYAYGEHAAPPRFDLEPNVIVSLVPYGFQRTGLTPEEFIQAWEKKCGTLALYDYWNIPDWSRNLPDLAPKTIVDKIRFWKDHHVRYFLAESTYCGGSIGLNWYLAARLLWDPNRDERSIIDDYFQQAFGTASPPLRRMYERWGSGFILSDHELALSFRNVHDALSLTSDASITARILDLARYVLLMSHWYDYQSASPKSPEQIARAKEYVRFLWANYESNMFQVFRLAQLIDRDMGPALAEIGPDHPMWKDIPPLSDADVLQLLESSLKQYQPLEFERRTFSSNLLPLKATQRPLSSSTIQTGLFGYSAEFHFEPPAETREVRIAIRVNAMSGPGKSDRVRVVDPKGVCVMEEYVSNSGDWQELSIATACDGTYSLSVIDQKNSFYLRVPENLSFVCSNDYSCVDLSPRTYFYVPRGLRTVAVHSPGVIPIQIFQPDGRPLDVERNAQGKSLFLIETAGQDGQVWSFSQFKSWEPFQLLNCPNVFAFSPTTLLVPQDAIEATP